MAETQPGSEPVDPARVISGFPDLDYSYVAKTAGASPEVVEVMLTPGIGHPEDGDAEFWAKDPGEWGEHGFRPTGEPLPCWKVVERVG